MEQQSDSWFAARLGNVTASRVSDVMAKTKSGYGASRKNYMMQLLCERLTGQREESFTSAAMQRGTELEPIARSMYEIETGVIVEEAGFILHPDIQMGASPDGLIADDGLIEIKCPNTAQHVDFIQSGKPDGKYQWQMLCQLECTGREWCHFVSFDDRMPDELQLTMVKFYRDEDRIKDMMKEVSLFLEELAEIEANMRNRMRQAA